MTEIDQEFISQVVKRVLARIESGDIAPAESPGLASGVFDNVDSAFAATSRAQRIWVRSPKKTKERVIAGLRQTMHDHAEDFARRALAETKMGRLEDKIAKHHNAADATPGLEDLESRSWVGDNGLVVEDFAPYGVIAAITPSTHPIPVLLNSIIIMIAPGNGVIFSVHPAAQHVSAYAMEIFNRTIQENGGPANLVTMIHEPSVDNTQQLFRHPQIPMIAATGGPAMVEAAFAAGKKVVAAGPGNPPVLVDATACVEAAAKHIIAGASFDNNILCIAEKETFVVDSVFDDFMKAMEKHGAVRLNESQIESLTQRALAADDKGHWYASPDFIGRNASVLARAAGLEIADEVRLLFGETGFDHPFVLAEQMMPFLPIVRVKSAAEGIELCVKAEHGFGHTAMIHSNDLKTITEFTRAVDTDIVVVNGPSPSGNGPNAGEGYFSHTIASPTGEGVCTPRNFARIRRLAVYQSLQIV